MSGALAALLAPRRIGVLGASTVASKFGHRIVRNLRTNGFQGAVYPVHHKAAAIADYPCVTSLGEMPEPIDLVLVVVQAAEVADGLEAAARAGAKAAVIFSSGFAETGEAGAALQHDMLTRAAAAGIRVVGPNCMGVRNFHTHMDASPMVVRPLQPGPVAMISQSGAYCSGACIALEAAGVGGSKIVSVGNMADVSCAELIRHLGQDDETQVITAFIEGVRDAADFLDAVAEVSVHKPIVILKGGRSKLGEAASMSHTSSLAGDGRIWTSLLREAGAQVVDGSDELFDVAAAFARSHDRLPRGRGVAIFTVAGGPAVVAADHCAMHGLAMPPLEHSLSGLKARIPGFASVRNPIDIPGSLPRDLFALVLDEAAGLEHVDAVLGIAIGLDMPEYSNALIRARGRKTVVTSITGAPNSALQLAAGGIANFSSVDRAVRALRHLVDRGTARHYAPPPASARVARLAEPPRAAMTEAAAKTLLRSYGLPVTREIVASSRAAAVVAAGEISGPVAMKISRADVLHKSDQGGVLLNVSGAEAVGRAFDILLDRFGDGAVLVQEMLRPGIELIIGAQASPATGPVVMVGFGGVLTEILDDVAFIRAPVSPSGALAAIGRLRGQKLLDGYRGFAAIDRAAIADIMALLSQILVANPDITEIDLNPVLSGAEGPVIADALIRTGFENTP